MKGILQGLHTLMNLLVKTLFTTVLVFCAYIASANMDSIGLKIFNDKVFIVHKVEKGQGLYSISRRYAQTVPNIEAYNPELKTNGLHVDQYIFIPTDLTVQEANRRVAAADKKRQAKEDGTAPARSKDDNVVYYTVKAGETLFSISRLEQCEFTIEQIKKWNNLTSNSLSEGQRLRIAFREKVRVEAPPVSKGTVRDVVEGTSSKDTSKAVSDTTTIEWNDVSEEGLASWIPEGADGDGKSYALYNGAKVGTIVRVENLANNKATYVRVIGPLAGTEGKNVIMVLTETAAKKLDVTDATFRIELVYSNDQL